MPTREIDDKPFKESTMTKLKLFERYAREWMPVFLTGPVIFGELNLCDFFSGSGTDSEGNWGSSLRLLKVVEEYRGSIANRDVVVRVHLSDKSEKKVSRLREQIAREGFDRLPVEIHADAATFETRFDELQPRLEDPRSANLLIIDEYGVKHFDESFDTLVRCPTTDFLAFLSSSWFHRFHSLPEVQRYLVDHRPEAYHQAHRTALESYRRRIPESQRYFLGDFSFKSGSNIYGVIFGSAHPLGMAKFLGSAWKLDGVNGSANFDVEREGIFGEDNLLLPFAETPKKVQVFEAELAAGIRACSIRDEMQVLELCFKHGVTPQHASPVLKKLKKESAHQAAWWVPDPRNHSNPRLLHPS